MKKLITIYKYLALIPAIPLIILSKIPIHIWHYYYTAIFVSKIPFFLWDLIRYWFYKFNLKTVWNNVLIMYWAVIQNRNVLLGNNVSIWTYNMIWSCTIWDNFMSWPYVQIIPWWKSHWFLSLDIPMRLQEWEEFPVTIWEDVWAGSSCIIMKNVWKWCIIWAGSVVIKEIQDYDIVWWNPAKIIKSRLNP